MVAGNPPTGLEGSRRLLGKTGAMVAPWTSGATFQRLLSGGPARLLPILIECGSLDTPI